MMTYLLSLGAGALTALSPCILPVLPIVAGSSMSERKSGPIYIMMGLTASLTVMGLVFSSVASLLGLKEEAIRLISASLLIIFGVAIAIPRIKHWMNFKFQGFSNSAIKLSDSYNSNHRTGQFGIGFLLGAAWSPCVGPTLGLALGLAGTQSGLLQAAVMMMLFGFGLSLPLLAIAYGFRTYIQKKRSSFLKFNNIGMKVLGSTIALVGILIITGADKFFESQLTLALPIWFIQISSML